MPPSLSGLRHSLQATGSARLGLTTAACESEFATSMARGTAHSSGRSLKAPMQGRVGARRAMHHNTVGVLSPRTRAVMREAEPQEGPSCFFYAIAMAEISRCHSDPDAIEDVRQAREIAISQQSLGYQASRPIDKVGGLGHVVWQGAYKPQDIEQLFARHGSLVFKAHHIAAPGTQYTSGYHALTLIEIRTLGERRCGVFYDPESVPNVHPVEEGILLASPPKHKDAVSFSASAKEVEHKDLFRVIPLDEFCHQISFAQSFSETLHDLMDHSEPGIFKLSPMFGMRTACVQYQPQSSRSGGR